MKDKLKKTGRKIVVSPSVVATLSFFGLLFLGFILWLVLNRCYF